MTRRILPVFIFLLLGIFLSGNVPAARAEGLSFAPSDRVIVVAPHPDDETLGAGGIIQSALAAGAEVKIVYLTRGESNEISALFYQKKPMIMTTDFMKIGRLRKDEAVRAMASLGIPEKNLIFFGYPDLGTMRIWEKFWEGGKPYRSFFTRVNKVIHHDDFSYGKYFRGYNIVHDFEKVLIENKPTHIFVTAPFDLNLDHQAAYLFLNTALLNLHLPQGEAPAVHIYLVHAHDWPKPRKLDPEAGLNPPVSVDIPDVLWKRYDLKPAETEKKMQALLIYQSQMSYAKNFLLSFVKKNEIYADYPLEKIAVVPGLTSSSWVAQSRDVKTGDVRYEAGESDLFITIPLIYALDEMGALSTSVFAYKEGALFPQMPKLILRLFGTKLSVRDQAAGHFTGTISYKIVKNRLLICIPMKALNDPDYLFVSTRTAKNKLTLDFGSWRLIRIVSGDSHPAAPKASA